MDTISAGNMAALVMECYEAGILVSEDLGGRAAQWDDGEFICWLLRQMGERKGYNALSAVGITEPLRPLDTDEEKVRFFKVGQLSWGINTLLSICNFCSIPIDAMTFRKLVEMVRQRFGSKWGDRVTLIPIIGGG